MNNLKDTRCGMGSLRLLAILLLCVPSFLCAQAPAPNRVLQLTDGKSYVELPPNIFDALTQALLTLALDGSLEIIDRAVDVVVARQEFLQPSQVLRRG